MIALAKGLGLWPEVIVDQHFVKRQRNNRLLAAVLDRRTLVGVGIDEATAVVVHHGAFEVLGKSSVVVIDPRREDRRRERGSAGLGRRPQVVGAPLGRDLLAQIALQRLELLLEPLRHRLQCSIGAPERLLSRGVHQVVLAAPAASL